MSNFGAGYALPAAQMNLRKPYEVFKLTGFVEKTVYKPQATRVGTKNKVRFVAEKDREAAGYLVKFAAGHSLRLSAREMKRQGFYNEPGIVDMATGDVYNPELQRAAELNDSLRDLSPNYIPAGDADGIVLGNMGVGKAKPKPRKPSPKMLEYHARRKRVAAMAAKEASSTSTSAEV